MFYGFKKVYNFYDFVNSLVWQFFSVSGKSTVSVISNLKYSLLFAGFDLVYVREFEFLNLSNINKNILTFDYNRNIVGII